MNFKLEIQTQAVPLCQDANGVVRVAQTRVTLDTVVYTFEQGATAEEIAQQYPSLSLADVYAVIAFYLRHCSDVREYLRKREATAQGIRSEIKAKSSYSSLRDRLLARRVQSDRP